MCSCAAPSVFMRQLVTDRVLRLVRRCRSVGGSCSNNQSDTHACTHVNSPGENIFQVEMRLWAQRQTGWWKIEQRPCKDVSSWVNNC